MYLEIQNILSLLSEPCVALLSHPRVCTAASDISKVCVLLDGALYS